MTKTVHTSTSFQTKTEAEHYAEDLRSASWTVRVKLMGTGRWWVFAKRVEK